MFKLKKKPIPPNIDYFISKEKEVEGHWQLGIDGKLQNYMSIADVVKECTKILELYPDARLKLDFEQDPQYYVSDSPTFIVKFVYRETDQDQYKIALAKYQKELTIYDSWYSANRKEIETEIKRREDYKAALATLNKRFM